LVVAHLFANDFLVSTAFDQQHTPGTLIFISIIEQAFVDQPKRLLAEHRAVSSAERLLAVRGVR
jgi:hypothetical protein